jgi:hypothetical protein
MQEEIHSKEVEEKAKALNLNKGMTQNVNDEESEEIKTEIELSSD